MLRTSKTVCCQKSMVEFCQKTRTYLYTLRELGHQKSTKKPEVYSPDEAVSMIKSDSLVFCHGAAATPNALINAMVDHAQCNDLKNITVTHMHTEGAAPYTQPEHVKRFRSKSLFMGGNVRKAVADGAGDNLSIFLQDLPRLFYRRILKPDVALIHVSPMDKHGYCSLGTSVDCTRAACLHAKCIVAQINKQMPRTFGDAVIHSSHFNACIEIDEKLPQHKESKISDVEAKIGSLIAENLVEDGATLQMGIGNIPDAVLNALHHHKDLGIHSEMFANGVVDLVAKGCVTNAHKPKNVGKTVGSFLVGNEKLYDFVDNNPSIEMLSVDYVNSTRVIMQLPKMTAINSCIEVDLTGQICSDSIGERFYSGFGGQVDFIRGAAEGIDGRGKPIIALASQTNKGQSKIVPTLKPGAGVVTTRAHVFYVVTEYGIASLFGKTMRQRAYELICVAHPNHREALEKAAYKRLKTMPSPD